MAHHPRKKDSLCEEESRQSSTSGQPYPSADLNLKNKQPNERPQIPFYDDPNHLAYGWQQMAALPDFPSIPSLVRGAQNEGPLSSQNWPSEQLSNTVKIEQSGFNAHPKLRQCPRRPPPLVIPDDDKHRRNSNRSAFRPFTDPPSTDQESAGRGFNHSREPLAHSVLDLKDANQKMQIGSDRQSNPGILKQTGDICATNRKVKRKHRRRKLVVDELESVKHATRPLARMPSLTEEPAPLRVRKNKTDEVDAHDCSTEQKYRLSLRAKKGNESRVMSTADAGKLRLSPSYNSHEFVHPNQDVGVEVTVREVTETEDDMIESLTTTITQQLSTLTPRLGGGFDHQSAVPKPLDLKKIKAAKAEREVSRSKEKSGNYSEGAEPGHLHGAKVLSVKSSATDTSSGFENLSTRSSSEHSGTKRKWYRGFRRSE